MPAALAAVAVLAGLLAAAVMIVGFAKPKAATSFGYRVQYWQATLHMIADRPWLGCGPGNFQDVYTQYKLPEASEEVADPHDFLLEVWATAGTPAMLALLAVLGLFFAKGGTSCRERPPWRSDWMASNCSTERHGGRSLQDVPGSAWKFVFVGAIGGFFLSIPLGQISSAPPESIAVAIGLPRCGSLPGVVAPLGPRPQAGALAFPPALAGLGVAVLLVDLLATGGIGIPAVAQSLWLLLALGLDGAWTREASRALAIVLLAIGLGLLVACHQTSYARVLPCQSLLRLAQREYLEGQRQSALETLQRAVDADPRSSDAHASLAEVYLVSWLANLDSADYDAFETQDAQARRMAPQSAPVWRESADRYRRAFAMTDAQGRHVQQRAIEQAIEIGRRTVELYPGSDIDRAALATIYQLSGDEVAYRREARAALELDQKMPHEDKKLPEALRRKLEAAAKSRS